MRDIDRRIMNTTDLVTKPSLRLEIKMPDLPRHEVIINPYENLLEKRGYYARAYDDDLSLIANLDIKITNWRFC